MKQDIFEDMSTEIGCEYISDLSLYKDQVEKNLLKISLEEYSEKQICELCEYVFGDSSILKSLYEKQNNDTLHL